MGATGNLGKLEIDIVAALSGFKGDLDKALQQLRQFGKQTAEAANPPVTGWKKVSAEIDRISKKMESLGRGMKKFGRELSVSIGLPLVGITYAAVRAADVTGDFGKELQAIRNTASNAIAPLGHALIDVFHEMEPAIFRALEVVRDLGVAFANLSPETQRTIVEIALVGIALGPVIIGGGHLLSLLGKITAAIGPLVVGLGKIGSWLGMLKGGMLSLGIVTAAVFSFIGDAAYNNLKPVRDFAAHTIATIADGFAYWKLVFSGVAIHFKRVFIEAVDAVTMAFKGLLDLLGGIGADILDKLAPGLGTAVAAATNAAGGIGLTKFLDNLHQQNVDLLAGIKTDQAAIVNEFADTLKQNQTVLDMMLVDNRRDFAGKSMKWPGVGGMFTDYFRDLKQGLEPVLAPIEARMAKFRERVFGKSEAGTAGPLTRSPLTDMTNAAAFDEAKRLQFEVFPLKKFEDDLARINRIRGSSSDAAGKLDPEAMIRLTQRMREAMLRAYDVDILPIERFQVAMKRLEDLKGKTDEIVKPEELRKAQIKLADDLIKNSDSMWAKMFSSFESWTDRLAGAIGELVVRGKADFKDLFQSLIASMVEAATKAAIIMPFLDAMKLGIGSLFTSSATTGGPATGFGGMGWGLHATGAAFARGRVLGLAAGGVLTGTTALGFVGSDMMVGGEDGPEAVLPLTRVGGDLGVRSTGGGVLVQVIDQRRSGAAPEVQSSQGPDGQKMIRILIRDEVNAGFGNGSFDKAMGGNFGVSRRGHQR